MPEAHATSDTRLLLPGREIVGRPINALELWEGATEHRLGRGRAPWKGGFRGRPELADLIWPALQECKRPASPPCSVGLNPLPLGVEHPM